MKAIDLSVLHRLTIQQVYIDKIQPIKINMTPKQKAEDLINNFHQFVPLTGKDMGYPTNSVEYKKFNAKSCALILCEEVIAQVETPSDTYKYWQEVKKEIENL